MLKPKSPADLAFENAQMREALNLIHRRAQMSRPNGTTVVLDRIAVAGLTGECPHQAAARPKQ